MARCKLLQQQIEAVRVKQSPEEGPFAVLPEAANHCKVRISTPVSDMAGRDDRPTVGHRPTDRAIVRPTSVRPSTTARSPAERPQALLVAVSDEVGALAPTATVCGLVHEGDVPRQPLPSRQQPRRRDG